MWPADCQAGLLESESFPFSSPAPIAFGFTGAAPLFSGSAAGRAFWAMPSNLVFCSGVSGIFQAILA